MGVCYHIYFKKKYRVKRGEGGQNGGKNPTFGKKKQKNFFLVIIFIPKLFLLLFLIKLAFLKILVAKISKTDKNWAHYNFLRLLFYVFIFQKNLQSVQKKMKIIVKYFYIQFRLCILSVTNKKILEKVFFLKIPIPSCRLP